MSNDHEYSKGLEGIIADETQICLVDGKKGQLSYHSYLIENLHGFEECAFLLVYGSYPNKKNLIDLKRKMYEFSILPGATRKIIESLPPSLHPVEALQTVVASLGEISSKEIKTIRKDLNGKKISVVENLESLRDDWLRLISLLPTLVAAFERHRHGFEILQPDPELSFMANFLYMFHGKKPELKDVGVIEICQFLQMEHGFNASTFTARIVASTLSPPHSTLASAIGALYGSIHGGADEGAFTMARDEIKKLEKVKNFVNTRLDQGKKIMGMGHRIYKTIDPRAQILKKLAKDLNRRKGGDKEKIYNILEQVEEEMSKQMKKKGKQIYANVEFYKGPVFNALEIPSDTFTCLFVMARAFGWAAHCLELWSDHRIYRPKALYVGPQPK